MRALDPVKVKPDCATDHNQDAYCLDERPESFEAGDRRAGEALHASCSSRCARGFVFFFMDRPFAFTPPGNPLRSL